MNRFLFLPFRKNMAFKTAVRVCVFDGAVRTTQDWSSRCVRGEVSLSCISRLIFVAHRTGKFPREEETRYTRQKLHLAKPAARVAAAGPTQHSPQGTLIRVPH